MKRVDKLETELELSQACLFLLMLIVWLVLSGCAQRVDAELLPYVERFEEEAAKGRYAVQIGFDVRIVDDAEMPGYKGMCERRPLSKSVKISRQYWEGATDREREAVVVHELAHCAIGMAHQEKGIMAAEYSAYGWSYREIFP
jgi:hypothetical protein